MKAGVHVMELGRDCMRLCFVFLYICTFVTLFTQCAEARLSNKVLKVSHRLEDLSSPTDSIIKTRKNFKQLRHFDIFPMSDPSNNNRPYVSSPFSLPPFESLAPIPLPQNTPPFCEYPPFTPQPPSTVIPTTPMTYTTPPPPPESSYPTPIFPIESPPPSPSSTLPNPSPPESLPTPIPPEYAPSPPTYVPNPPEYVPSPPTYVSSPPEYVPSPPSYTPGPPAYVPSPPKSGPSPPEYGPSPPSYNPSPTVFVPSPPGFAPRAPVFQPPVVYPPPSVPPSPHNGPGSTLWCVAKPSVPDPIIQEAMNYACGSGADCGSIQPNGLCYNPDTLFAHASFAFNSYWQRTKAAGGTCDFGGTAMLVTVDPSFDGCQFLST